MGSVKKKRGQISSDRAKWEVIFKALKLTLLKQKSQIESLLEERNLLERRLRDFHQRYVSDLYLADDQISQLERQISLAELAKLVETAKANLLVGSKQRDALVYKLKLAHAQNELNDFKAWFDILSHRCSNQEDISPNKLYECLKAKDGMDSSSKDLSVHSYKSLEKEVVRLKREYEKLSVKNSSDISALQAEISFVWNQYKEMESNYTNQLQTKHNEISRANEKVTELLAGMEQLQSSNAEKDVTVATLRDNITKLESVTNEKDGEISRLTKELELLRAISTAGLPVLKNCSNEPSSSSLTGSRKSRSRRSAAQEEETSPKQLEAAVAILRAKITEVEAESNEKDGEISRLTKELESLRARTTAGLPVLENCANEPSTSSLTGSRKRRTRRSEAQEEETSPTEQEATVATLRAKITELEAETNKKDGEILTLSKELQLLRSKNAADTPALKRCTGEPSDSRSRGRGNGGNKRKLASSAELVIEQGSKGSRKQAKVVTYETPKLFTSQFRVPKLKIQSP